MLLRLLLIAICFIGAIFLLIILKRLLTYRQIILLFCCLGTLATNFMFLSSNFHNLVGDSEQIGMIQQSEIFYNEANDEYFAIKTHYWDFMNPFEKIALNQESVQELISEYEELEEIKKQTPEKQSEIYQKQLELDKIILEDLIG